jgi:hypothetical protein
VKDENISERGRLLKRLLLVFFFGIAFAYIESAVVVYLRAIFHSDGFTFPLTVLGDSRLLGRFLLTEIGREAATLVIIFSATWLLARTAKLRLAYFFTIFALWDIFYYIWLKVLIDWPASIMDWDILFLIPMVWASPVLAPVLASVAMLAFAAVIFAEKQLGLCVKFTRPATLLLAVSALVMIVSFCIAGRYISSADYTNHFNWYVFAAGYLLFIITAIKSVHRTNQ